MRTAAKLHRDAGHLHNPYTVGVLVAEKRQRSFFQGLLIRHVGMFHQCFGFTNTLVHFGFDRFEFTRRNLLEMAEIETQPVGTDKRTFLLHMLTEHLPQSCVQEMGRGMVALRRLPRLPVDRRPNGDRGVELDVCRIDLLSRETLPNLAHHMNGHLAVPLRIDNVHDMMLALDQATVARLAAAFRIKRRAVEHKLQLVSGNFHPDNLCSGFERFVPDKHCRLRLLEPAPFALISCKLLLLPAILPGALFLLQHTGLEPFLIDRKPLLGSHQTRQVERKTVGVVQPERIFAPDDPFPGRRERRRDLGEHLDSAVERHEEAFLF